MATVLVRVNIESDVKKASEDLFAELGIDMSKAINLFLRWCVLHGGLPFAVEVPQYNKKTLDAMEEAKRISSDSSAPGYYSMDGLKSALEDTGTYSDTFKK